MQPRLPSESNILQLDYNFEADSGAISSNGKFYWMVSGNELEIFRLTVGTRTGHWAFADPFGQNAMITMAEEVHVHNRRCLFVGLQFADERCQLRLIDPYQATTLRIIQLDEFIPISVCSVPVSEDSPLSGRSMEGQINFQCPVAIGTTSGRVLVMDLFYDAEMYSPDTVEAEELKQPNYESVGDLGREWNAPFFLLNQDHTGRVVPPRNLSITCVHLIQHTTLGRLLLVGTHRASMEVWSLESLKRLGLHEARDQKLPVFSFSFDVNSSAGSLLVTFSKLDGTRSAIVGRSKGLACLSMFKMDCSLEEEVLLQPTGYSRAFRLGQFDAHKVKSSQMLHSTMVPTGPASDSEQCFFVWKVERSRSTEICAQLLNLDWVLPEKLADVSEEQQSAWYTSFEVPAVSGPVAALVLPESVEDFFQVRGNSKLRLPELYRAQEGQDFQQVLLSRSSF